MRFLHILMMAVTITAYAQGPESQPASGTDGTLAEPMVANQQVNQIPPINEKDMTGIEDMLTAFSDLDDVNQDAATDATFSSVGTPPIWNSNQAGIETIGNNALTQQQNAKMIVNIVLGPSGTPLPNGNLNPNSALVPGGGRSIGPQPPPPSEQSVPAVHE